MKTIASLAAVIPLIASCNLIGIKNETNRRPLSEQQVQEIADNSVIARMKYLAERDNMDQDFMSGLHIEKPFVTWGVRHGTREIFPMVWTVRVYNGQKELVATEYLDIESGRFVYGGSPSTRNHRLHYEFPKDLSPIIDEAWKNQRVRLSGDEIQRSILLQFWDAKRYWLFPYGPNEHPSIIEFNRAVDSLESIDLESDYGRYYMIPVDQYREERTEPTSTIGLIEPLADMFRKIEDRTIKIP